MTSAPVSDTSVSPQHIVHVERNYTAAGGAKYLLPSDDGERKRLAFQHHLLKRFFDGNLVLPPTDFSGGGNVLDSGTGSGIWILDALEAIPPSVTFHGIDIEPGLFPTLDTTLNNRVHFSVNSITNLPKDWQSTFTLVHQRLLLSGLQQPEWKVALKEIYRVLIPGGWVQLGELGTWHGGPVSDKHKLLIQALYNSRDLIWDCAVHLPTMLEEAGFVNIHIEERAIPVGNWGGQNGVDARDNFMEVYRAMKTPILKAGGFGYVDSEAEYDAFMDNLEQEYNDRPGAEFNYYGIYAQKPLDPHANIPNTDPS